MSFLPYAVSAHCNFTSSGENSGCSRAIPSRSRFIVNLVSAHDIPTRTAGVESRSKRTYKYSCRGENEKSMVSPLSRFEANILLSQELDFLQGLHENSETRSVPTAERGNRVNAGWRSHGGPWERDLSSTARGSRSGSSRPCRLPAVGPVRSGRPASRLRWARSRISHPGCTGRCHPRIPDAWSGCRRSSRC